MDQRHGSSGAGSQLRGAAGEARDAAREAAEVGRERGRSFVEHRKEAAAQQLHGVAQALRDTASKLEEGEAGEVPDLVQRAAGGLERLSSSLRERDVDGLVNDLEDFARRSPALYLGSAAAGGFLLARFLKSSGERRRHQRERDRLPAASRSQPPAAGATATRPFGSSLAPAKPHGEAGGFGAPDAAAAGSSMAARPSSRGAGSEPAGETPRETS